MKSIQVIFNKATNNLNTNRPFRSLIYTWFPLWVNVTLLEVNFSHNFFFTSYPKGKRVSKIIAESNSILKAFKQLI